MTLRSWARKLFARPVARRAPEGPHKAPPRCRDAPDRRNLSWPEATANRKRKRRARSPRLARPTIGFWLGGGLTGTGGGILGACMPYHHPVAVVISALWWGIYLGCFGASVGALIALFIHWATSPRCDHKLEREDCSERLDEQDENQSILVLRKGSTSDASARNADLYAICDPSCRARSWLRA
jgi:hypothetical protein